MQENWKIELSEKPLNEFKILSNTGGITGDGQKIIKFQYNSNQIKSIDNDLIWNSYDEYLKTKFDELEFLLTEEEEKDLYSKFIDQFNKDIDNNKFFLTENHNKFLILALNLKSNELIAFINYQ